MTHRAQEQENKKNREMGTRLDMWSNSMNNNPSVDKMWIIIMLLLEEGLMEKCVTVSLRMTSIIMTSFYAIKEKRFVTVCAKAE